ncbi:hypothetical protein M405DRAFT_821227 [Rhizopogon salebrosus TDB-379]|nr:hypothetical protein M405DRAFT_821227 [Rhizopogon salebrosus TDB-379]
MIKARIGDTYSRLAAVLLMKDPDSNIPQSLTVLYYLLHTGSENVFLYFRDNLYIIKTLKEFQYVDEDGNDNGANVRQKAEDVSNFLNDPAEERRKVLEATWKELMEKLCRIPEEIDLAAAIRLSEDEKAKRHKAVEAATLFDDQAQISSPNVPNSNNPFIFTDPATYATGLQPQQTFQPQFTNPATYATGLQPQRTFQPQFTMQPQFALFNPFRQRAQQVC